MMFLKKRSRRNDFAGWNRFSAVAIMFVGLVALGIQSVQLNGQTDDKKIIDSAQDAFQIAMSYDVAKGQSVAHPDFILPSIDGDGETIQLSKHRGKKVLLLHFASW